MTSWLGVSKKRSEKEQESVTFPEDNTLQNLLQKSNRKKKPGKTFCLSVLKKKEESGVAKLFISSLLLSPHEGTRLSFLKFAFQYITAI